MGYAIQRGATCMVAAVDEVVSKRRARRLLAIGEASAWVAGGMLLFNALNWLPLPASIADVTLSTVLGGILLGLGALLGRACVFGAIARFGSGDVAYLLSPVGFYVGCLTVAPLTMSAPSAQIANPSLLGSRPIWAVLPLVILAVWRLSTFCQAIARKMIARHIWSPHVATSLIGIAFVVMLPLVGMWAYTDGLRDVAAGKTAGALPRAGLLLALLIGSAIGGWTANRSMFTAPRFSTMAKAFSGGVLMGWGSLWIPGSNDGLILIGLPLLYPYAWVAIACMVVAIVAGLSLERLLYHP